MPSMLILSFVEWSGAFQRPQHMAIGFAKRGWDVTYVSPGYIHRGGQQVEPGVELPASLKVLTPPALPGARKLDFIGRLNEESLRRSIARHHPGAFDVIIFNDPRWAKLASGIEGRRRIWDNMDDLSAQAPSEDWIEEMEDASLGAADRIWTGTAMLADRHMDAGRKAKFIPCGVEGDRFAAAQIEEQKYAARRLIGPIVVEVFKRDKRIADHPLVIYFGALNERIRADLIGALAEEGCFVLLIGPTSSQAPSLEHLSTVRSIGPRPYAQLPAFLAEADFAIIPYDYTGAHRFLYPVKALEYLAGGKPVLSTPLPDVVRFLGDYVLIEGEAEGWRRVAREWKTIQPEAERRALKGQSYALSRSWDAMIDEMIKDLAWG